MASIGKEIEVVEDEPQRVTRPVAIPVEMPVPVPAPISVPVQPERIEVDDG